MPVRCEPDRFRLIARALELFDDVGDGVFVAAWDGRVLLANGAAEKLLGEGVRTLNASEWPDYYSFLLPDGAKAKFPDEVALLRAARGETMTREVVHVSAQGLRNVWLSVTARPVYDEQGQFEWTFVIVRDINLRMWAEEGMRLRDRAMASAGEGVSIIDTRAPDQPITYVNDALIRMLGFSREEILGRTWWFLVGSSPNQESVDRIRETIRAERPCTCELQSHRKDGTPFWTRISMTPVRDSAGTLTHYIVIQSDITERIETEAKLAETTEKLRAANEEISRANRNMRRNLEAAARLQRDLLPTQPPEAPGFKFAWAFRPSEELSGDLLNVVPLRDNKIALYLLDVAGHGVASAMLSVTVNRLLSPVESTSSLVLNRRRNTSEPEYEVVPPRRVVARLAKRFRWDADTGLFFTFVYGLLDCEARTFSFVSAGHPPPLLLDPEGNWHQDKPRHLPIGIGYEQYEETRLELRPGSRLFLYSDGIVEAMNAQRELYGLDRMLDRLRGSRQLPLNESVNQLIDVVHVWRKNGPLRDDISIVALEAEA